MIVGRIQKIFRYPVKSMAGQAVQEVVLDEYGMVGDRCWSMIQDASGDLAGGKNFPKLMNLEATYVDGHPSARVYGDAIPHVEIRFPDNKTVRSDSDPNSIISDYAGSELHLHPLERPEHRDHYRYESALDGAAILKLLGIGEHEVPPDLSVYDQNLVELVAEYFSPPGTYHDLFPIHFLTTATIEHMRRLAGGEFVVHRFRPNFVIETTTDIEGLAEFEWVGKHLQIGETRLQIDAKTIRCAMPTRGQSPHGLTQQPSIGKSIFEATNRFLGAYASLVQTGQVKEGDEVRLLD